MKEKKTKKQIKVRISCDGWQCERKATGKCEYCSACFCSKCTEENYGECPDCTPPRIIPLPPHPKIVGKKLGTEVEIKKSDLLKALKESKATIPLSKDPSVCERKLYRTVGKRVIKKKI